MTNLKSQRRMAADILKVGKGRVWIDPSAGTELKGAITKNDIRKFISLGMIKAKPLIGTSTARAKIIKSQKKKGRRSGIGSRKGTLNSRKPRKLRWMIKIRALRNELTKMRVSEKITRKEYSALYRQAGAGMFRDKGHLRLTVDKMKQQ